jgi:hypothetical protein
MVLIGPCDLKATDLPFSDMIEYQVIPEEGVLKIKLISIAKRVDCIKVYLHHSMKSMVLAPDVAKKVDYFYDNDELIGLLQMPDKQDDEGTDGPAIVETNTINPEDLEPTEFNPVIEQQQEDDYNYNRGQSSGIVDNGDGSGITVSLNKNVDEFGNPLEESAVDVPADNKSSENKASVVEEVDASIDEEMFTIPCSDMDTDALKTMLQTKDEIIAQKDLLLKEITESREELYSLQEEQMLLLQQQNDAKIAEANQIIAQLKEKLSTSAEVSPEVQHFLNFMPYVTNYNAKVSDTITPDERAKFGNPKSEVHIFAAGAGDSMYAMMQEVVKLIEKNPEMLIVDFLNDGYLSIRNKWATKYSMLSLSQSELGISDIVKLNGRTAIIPSTTFNDIALLGIDWGEMLKKIFDFANGKPVLMLFNSISSFAVRYTVSKLASLGSLNVFVKSNPIMIQSTFNDIKYIPPARVRMVALDYIEPVKGIIAKIGQTYNVIAFPQDVDWGKFGIKV